MPSLTHKVARRILASDGIAAVEKLQAAADNAHQRGYAGAAAAIREIADAADGIVAAGSSALKKTPPLSAGPGDLKGDKCD